MNTWRIEKGDLALHSDGTTEEIGGTKKVVQDLEWVLVNETDFNRFHPWMGSGLEDYIGQINTPEVLHSIKQEVRRALQAYADSQIDEIRERIEASQNAYLAVGHADPTSIVKEFHEVSAENRGTDVKVTVSFSTFTGESDVASLLLSLES